MDWRSGMGSYRSVAFQAAMTPFMGACLGGESVNGSLRRDLGDLWRGHRDPVRGVAGFHNVNRGAGLEDEGSATRGDAARLHSRRIIGGRREFAYFEQHLGIVQAGGARAAG